MDLKHIREFIEIADCGNFLESADNLEISQSALSKHIQTLEKELGTELFKRTTRKVFLSEAGKIFLPYALQLNDIYNDMQTDIEECIAKDRRKISIGGSPLMANYGIMKIISEFKLKNPKTVFNLIEYNNYIGTDIAKSLLNFEFDLAFWTPVSLNPERFEIIDYYIDRFVALIHVDHPLSTMKEIDVKLLSKEKLLLMDNSTPYYDICYNLFNKVGFNPNVIFTGVRIENFIEMVSNKMGIAILLQKHITGVNKNYTVIREISPTATRTISFARVKNRHHSPISTKFWNFLKDNINQENLKLLLNSLDRSSVV